MPRLTLFFSYSRKDEAIARRLKDDVSRAGASVWIDHEQLPPGTPNWQAAIRQGIEQAHVLIYIASPEAATSPYVIDEVSIARAKGRRVIPFWARGQDWHDCAPLGLGTMQYIDGRGDRYEKGLLELQRALSLGPSVHAGATAYVAVASDPDFPSSAP